MRTLVLAVVLALPGIAAAVPLDPGRHIHLRGKLYTEASIFTEDREPQTTTSHAAGQLVSHRTFVNPELEADLRPWLSLGLDTFSFRLALWAFYDGVYDYTSGQYDRARDRLGARFTEGRTSSAPVTRRDRLRNPYTVYAYQTDPVLGEELPFRVNEAYFDVAKGPVTARLGRQAISWGEVGHDRAARPDEPVRPDAWHPRAVRRHRRGAHPAVDRARHLSADRRMGRRHERVPRRLPGTG